MRYLHTLDPAQIREMEMQKEFDRRADEEYERYKESNNQKSLYNVSL